MRQDYKATITACSSTFQRKMYCSGPLTMEALGCVFHRPASCLCVPVSQSTTASSTTDSFLVDLVSSLKSCHPWTDSLSSFPMLNPQNTH